MAKIKVISESAPQRCEICHKNDRFDAARNYCDRCHRLNHYEFNSVELELLKYKPLPLISALESNHIISEKLKNYIWDGVYSGCWSGFINGTVLFILYYQLNINFLDRIDHWPDSSLIKMITISFISTIVGMILGALLGIITGLLGNHTGKKVSNYLGIFIAISILMIWSFDKDVTYYIWEQFFILLFFIISSLFARKYIMINNDSIEY